MKNNDHFESGPRITSKKINFESKKIKETPAGISSQELGEKKRDEQKIVDLKSFLLEKSRNEALARQAKREQNFSDIGDSVRVETFLKNLHIEMKQNGFSDLRWKTSPEK